MMKKRRFIHAALVLLGAFTLDCGLSDSGEDVGTALFAYKGGQGERLQAADLGGTWAAQATGAIGRDGAALDSVFVDRAELRATRGAVTFTGAALVGARILAKSAIATPTADLELRVRGIAPHNGAPGEFEYTVEYRSIVVPGQPYKPLCQDAGARAVPVTGTWHTSGAFVNLGAGAFSFACVGGVIVKCLDWGYKPWASFPQPPGAPVAVRPYHQVCTRLARADYCGAGDSYTIDKTPIDIYDRLPINTQTPAVPGSPPYLLESIWGYDPGPTGGPTALKCLSKKRWDTIPLGGNCPLKVPDPRVDRRASFCEDKTWSQWQALGAIMANDSLFIDAGLFRWRKVGGEDHYTTSQYIYRGAQPSPTGPPPGGYQFAEFEGAAYRDDLGAAGILPAGSLTPLYSFFSPSRGDHFTTSVEDPNSMVHPPWDAAPLDYSQKTLLGYVYKPPVVFPSPAPHPRAKLLGSWYSPSRKEHVTSRTKPSPAINDDFVLVRIEGYVILKQ